VLIASRSRWAHLGELDGDLAEPPFRDLVERFDPGRVDVVLAEGFARESYPKIEVYRPALGEPPRRWPADAMVIAVATDAPLAVARPVRRLNLNAPGEVAGFLLEHLAEAGGFSANRAG
jgi:molybdopterin-guanine dinucleotide biosynthesis protein B